LGNRSARGHRLPGEPAPMVELLQKKPWLLPNLYSGRIPHGEK
jgi:hypothetical protein